MRNDSLPGAVLDKLRIAGGPHVAAAEYKSLTGLKEKEEIMRLVEAALLASACLIAEPARGALQQPALKAWNGNAGNVAAAQKALYHRARMNSLASTAAYSREFERPAA